MVFAVSKTKTVLKYAAFFVCAAALFCRLYSCAPIINESAKAVKIEVISSSPPQVAGKFNYADFSLKVSYDDGTGEIIALKEYMIAKSDLAKFCQSGFYSITVNYLSLSCSFLVSIIDEGQAPFSFAVISGAHISADDDSGIYKFTALLEELNGLSIEHLIFNGDMIQGSEKQYGLLLDFVESAFDSMPQIYYTLGEFERLLQTGLSEQAAFEVFNDYFEQQKNFCKTVCGTDFLFVSGVDIGGYIDESLKAEIELFLDTASKDKLVFVVYGGKLDSFGGRTLQELLCGRKNAVLLTADKEHYKTGRNILSLGNTVVKCAVATAQSVYDSFISLNSDLHTEKSSGTFERQTYGYLFSVLGESAKVQTVGGAGVIYLIDAKGNCNCIGDGGNGGDITAGGLISASQNGRLARITGNIFTDRLAEAFVIELNGQNTQRRILVFNSAYQLSISFEFEINLTENAQISAAALGFDQAVSQSRIDCLYLYEEPQDQANQGSLFDYFTESRYAVFDSQTSLSGRSLKLSLDDGQSSMRLEFTNDDLFDLKGKDIYLSAYFSGCYCIASLGLITDSGDDSYMTFQFDNAQNCWQTAFLRPDILFEITGFDTARVKTFVLTVNFITNSPNCLVFFDNFMIR